MLHSFRSVKGETKCPFAKKAKIIELRELENLSDGVKELKNILPQLSRNGLDGAILPLPKHTTDTLEEVGFALFYILNNLDPNCVRNVESKDWRLFLEFDGVREKYFIACFWDGYSNYSPRKCPEGAFILFQPKSSFVNNGLRGGELEDKLRQNIRKLFSIVGKPYEKEELEAERFLPNIKWWE